MDAVVAVRSFPRRYRAALAAALEDDAGEDADALALRRPDDTTWSAGEYVAHVAAMANALADAVHRANVEADPMVVLPDNAALRGPDRLEPALEALDTAMERVAEVTGHVAAGDWQRPARVAAGATTALELLREAVHEGSHHLRDVADVLDRVRAR